MEEKRWNLDIPHIKRLNMIFILIDYIVVNITNIPCDKPFFQY